MLFSCLGFRHPTTFFRSWGEISVPAVCLCRRKRPPSRIWFITRRHISQEVAQRLLLRLFHYWDASAAASVHLLPDTNLSGEGLSCFIAEYCRRWNIQFHTVAMSLNSAWVVDLETLAFATVGILSSLCITLKGEREKINVFFIPLSCSRYQRCLLVSKTWAKTQSRSRLITSGVETAC